MSARAGGPAEPASGQRVVAVVLAAGRSTRFGGQKLLADVGGEPLVRRAVREVLASSVEAVTVVLGADARSVANALQGLPVELVHNTDYASGMGTSIAAGVRSLTATADAVVIALGDQPTAGGATIDALIEAWRTGGRPIVAPEWGGVRAPPVLFARSMFGSLENLTGDRGARNIMEADPVRVGIVAMEGPPPPDIDTRADHRAFGGGS